MQADYFAESTLMSENQIETSTTSTGSSAFFKLVDEAFETIRITADQERKFGSTRKRNESKATGIGEAPEEAQKSEAAALLRKLYEDNGYKRVVLGEKTLLPTGDTLTAKELKMPNGDRIALFGAGHLVEVNGKVSLFTDAVGKTSVTFPNGDSIEVYRDKIVTIKRNGYLIVFDEKDKGAAFVLEVKKK